MIRKLGVVLLAGTISLLGLFSVWAMAYQQAPELDILVTAGELPLVEERLPKEPYVREPFDEIGRYGGTLYVYGVNETVWQDFLGAVYNEPTLVRVVRTGLDAKGRLFEPCLLNDYEWSDNYKILTLYLREGARWSDGEPLTADDFTFYWLDCKPNFNKDVPIPETPLPFNLEKVEKVDDYTVRFYFPQPSPAAVLTFLHGSQSMWGGFVCSHYLKKWHISYNPKANELAKEEGFENWWQALDYHGTTQPMQNDLDLPMVAPWILARKTANLKIYERNPYYFAVDPVGNQLPYIDRVVFEVVSLEVYELKVLSGAADIAEWAVTLVNYPLYKKNQEKGNYQILFKPGVEGSKVGIYFNWFDEDLVLRKIFRDIRFRRALSLGIDREEINETIFFGKAVPRQAIYALPTASWYKKEWDEYYTQYDPERANGLLDEMGLKWDKDHKYRLRPDGKSLVLVTEYMNDSGYETPVLELVKKRYEAIGINMVLKMEAAELYRQRAWTNAVTSVQASNIGYCENIWGWVFPLWAWPSPGAYVFAKPWGQWLQTGGQSGEEPPEDIKEQYARVQKLRSVSVDSEEAQKLLPEMTEFALEKLWHIGTVGMVPVLIIAKNTLGNVVDLMREYDRTGRKYVLKVDTFAGLHDWVDQIFFKE